MKNYIQSTKNYRYFTLGNPEIAKKLIFVLHGYGQMPEYFIQKFNKLGDEYFIVAPEGMHRFYLKGSSGRVGASWMTKEERLCDIADTLHFLNRLYAQFSGQFALENIRILGFSQGAATAARWFYSSDKLAHELIIWASVFPPDLAISDEINPTTNFNAKFVIGNQDEYFNAEQQKELIQFYDAKGFKVFKFEGKHDIDTTTLARILS
jgi:predicted esterase